MRPDSAEPAAPGAQEREALATLFAAGRFAEAASAAQALIARFPSDGFGWNALGAAYKLTGRHGEALSAMKRAAALSPLEFEAHFNLANALREAGRLEEAEAAYRRALELKPDSAETHNNLGLVEQNLGRLAAAEAGFGRALELKPDFTEAHNNLGIVHLVQGRAGAAEASFRRALQLRPDYAEAHNNLGNALKALGRLAEAGAAYRRALELRPDYLEALGNLGHLRAESPEAHFEQAIMLRSRGRAAEAMASYRRAIELKPDYAEAHNNLGILHGEVGRRDEAEACYRRALEVRPEYPEAWSNLGIVLHELGRLDEAEASYRRALAIKPDFAEVYSNLGNALKDLGRFADAEAEFRRALELKPDFAVAHSNLGNILSSLGRLEEAEACYRRTLEVRPDLGLVYSNLLFLMGQSGRATPARYLEQARGYDSTIPAALREQARRRAFSREPRAGRRLRVGYVSGDFKTHSVSYFFEPVLQSHDRSRVEVFAYSTSGKRDAVTERIESAAEHWTSLFGEADDAAAELVMRDQIDVLVDLSGHTTHNRLALFARRVAPVQCHYVGYFASTGLSEMDYFLGDEVLIPEAHNAHFSETVWRLPRTFSSYAAPAHAPEPVWQPEEGRVCLGSFNSLAKITEHTIALWARVLQRLPQAYLLLKTAQLEEPRNRERIHAQFEAAGIARSRIELLGGTPDWNAHMTLYSKLAVALDPVGAMAGATTTCDALWMGVPVVTLEGDRMSGRLAATMVEAIGHGEWRAKSEEEYVEIVARLVTDEAQRKALRSAQRETMRRSALCDAAGLTRALEEAYEAMFDRWWAQRVQAQSPEAEIDLHFNLGNALREEGRLEEACISYRRVLALRPHYKEALGNLGNALRDLGRLAEAEAMYRRALAAAPDFFGAHYGLGLIHLDRRRLEEAEASCRRAIELKPDFAEAHNNLGIARKELGRLREAEACFRHALGIRPDYPHALLNLGNTLRDLGRVAEAEASYRRVLAVKPDWDFAHNNRLFLLAQAGTSTPEQYLEEARSYELQTIPAEASATARKQTFVRLPRAGRRLRVGYVSGDFRAHAVSYFFEPVLGSHDRNRVEVFAYSSFDGRDAVAERMRRSAEHWHSLIGVSDEAARELVARHEIDVLVDLSGHTAHNRLGLFARRAAPVQCHYLGYFASTGLSEMDYVIGDEVLIPEAHAAHFSERIWRLPRTFSSYAAPANAPAPAWQLEADGAACVGSLNKLSKVTPRTVALWAKLLERLPHARLLLKAQDLDEPANRERLHAAFGEQGIASARVELLGGSRDWLEHMALYGRLAVALDPVGGAGGATTTCEALWMGVPVVTLDGDRMAGRLTATMVEAIGHGEWRAKSEGEYVEIVARLIEDEAQRRELRFGLRETMRRSALCDAAGLTRALEDAYEAMFDRWSFMEHPR